MAKFMMDAPFNAHTSWHSERAFEDGECFVLCKLTNSLAALGDGDEIMTGYELIRYVYITNSVNIIRIIDRQSIIEKYLAPPDFATNSCVFLVINSIVSIALSVSLSSSSSIVFCSFNSLEMFKLRRLRFCTDDSSMSRFWSCSFIWQQR